MRVTKEMLQQQVQHLLTENQRLRTELEMSKYVATRDHELSNRLLTIFERTAGDAQLRLSGAGSAAAINLEREKQETIKLQKGFR